MILDHLRTAGVHQHQKNDSIRFTSLVPWPGEMICAQGRYTEGVTGGASEGEGVERRAGLLIGPEFGTLARAGLVRAAREATEAGFDVLIACAFNCDAHASDLTRLGPLPILKARMNPDLHMWDELKNTGKGNCSWCSASPTCACTMPATAWCRYRCWAWTCSTRRPATFAPPP